MKAIIIVHEETEGPGTLGDFLDAQGVDVHVARLFAGDTLPEKPSGFSAVISMGGPMNVYENDKYPFLEMERGFLKQGLDMKVPMLGVCLGAQMLAHAGGARVVKSPKEEVGWSKVFLTDEGSRAPLFQGLPGELEVFQWHGDMFHIPTDGTLLATGTDCPHQAFRYSNAFGLQFHVEITRELLARWFADSRLKDSILEGYDNIRPVLDSRAETMYRNFLELT
ncbi:MAG: type 1 glutamine amidotransferase [Pseudomonadota bacterium]